MTDHLGDGSASEEPNLDIRMPPELEAGVWSNFAIVSHSPYEFTLDFIRLDFSGNPPTRGVVVQRVNMSPQFVEQLISALNENIQTYASRIAADLAPHSESETEGDDG